MPCFEKCKWSSDMPSTNTQLGIADKKNKYSSVQDGKTASDAAASRALDWASARLGAVDQLIKGVISGPGIMAETAAYHLAAGGKRFRPMFLLAIANAVSAPEQVALQTAAACELLHNASLVHDDLQDKDATRRGRPAVWQKFGPEIAINLGDYFIASAFSLLAGLDCHYRLRVGLTDLFAETTRIVINGQSDELSASGNLSLTINGYESIARRKSGMLLALPVSSALTITDTGTPYAKHAGSAMQWMGIAYQVQDDLVDLFGLKDGRPAGVDLREGRVSLPVIYFVQGIKDDSALDAFSSFFRSNVSSTGECEYWIDQIINSKAVDQCIGHINVAVARASRHLENLTEELRSIIRAGQYKMMKHTDTMMHMRDASAVSHV
jgi:geranylgeranyl pyrophosphate synthase